MKNNIRLFLFIGALSSVSVAEVAVPPPEVVNVHPVDPVSALLDQLAVVKLLVTVRAVHFPSPAAQKNVLALLDQVNKNLAKLLGDRAYTEATWFLTQIATAVGNVGVDLQQDNDITSTVNELLLRSGQKALQETRVPLATSFYWILMQEIYKDLAHALSLIPKLNDILKKNESTSIHG